MKKLIILIAIIMGITTNAQTTWMVDSLNDSGYGSLRAAADSCSSGDTIRFSPSLIANGSDTILLTTGEIAIDSIGVVIKGAFSSTDSLFISGNNSSRIFSFGGGSRIVLDSLALINGTGIGSFYTNTGAAVMRYDCSDTLFINNSKISDNSTYGGNGAVCNLSNDSASALSVYNSTILNNVGGGIRTISSSRNGTNTTFIGVINSVIQGNSTAGSSAGAIYVHCKSAFSGQNKYYGNSLILIENSSISGNTATANGGAILTQVSHNVINIKNSTFAGNSSTAGNGGAICGSTASNEINILNSTFSGNSASRNNSYGGAIFIFVWDTENYNRATNINIQSSTFSWNNAVNGGGVAVHSLHSDSSTVNFVNSTLYQAGVLNGSAIYSRLDSSNYSAINISSSIVAKYGGYYVGSVYNTHTPTLTSGGYNVFSDSISGVSSLDSVNVSFQQLNLQQLGYYGGETQTMVPNPGSIAVNNGNPLDFSNAQNSSLKGVRDIGAAEYCPTSSGVDTIVSCDSITWIDGITYTMSTNTPTTTLVNSLGCDSTVTLNLTILNSTYSTDVIVSCDSVTWIDGITYYASNNTAKDTLVNAVGCDSVITLDLTINSSITFLDTIIACDSLTWIDGVTYYSNNNTAMDTLTTAAGCDSVVTLDLIVNHSTSFTDVVIACDSLTWINGVTYYSSNNIVMDTLMNAAGCDSVVMLDLTIETLDSSVVQSKDTLTAVVAGATYQWIDCLSNTIVVGAISQQFVPVVSGTYKVEISKGFCLDTSSCYQVVVCDAAASFSSINNGSGSIDFTSLSGGSFTQSHWSFGDGSSSTLSNPSHTYLANGNYVAVLTINDSLASNSCTSHFMDTISVTGVSSSVVCQAGFSVYYDTIAGTVNVVNSSVGSNLTYAWDFGDGNSSNLEYPSHSYSTNGPFNLCLTIDDGNGCTGTYCDSISNQGVWFRTSGFNLIVEGSEPLGIGEVSLSNNINIYPNPVHDQVNIEINNWPTNGVNIVVRDITGKQVYTQNVEPISNKETIQINTSKWAKGTYFIEVGAGENRVIEQIVVQ